MIHTDSSDILTKRRNRHNISSRRNPSFRRRPLRRDNSSILAMPGAFPKTPSGSFVVEVEPRLASPSSAASSVYMPGAFPEDPAPVPAQASPNLTVNPPSDIKFNPSPSTKTNPPPINMPTPRKKVPLARSSSIYFKFQSPVRREEEKIWARHFDQLPRHKARDNGYLHARPAVFRATAESMDRTRRQAKREAAYVDPDQQARLDLAREWMERAKARQAEEDRREQIRRAREKEEAEARWRAEVLRQQQKIAEETRRQEEQARLEEEVRRRAVEARRRAEEEARFRAEAEVRRRAEAEARRAEELRRAQEEEFRRQEEYRRAQEEEFRRQEEHRRQEEYRRQQEANVRNSAGSQQPQSKSKCDEIFARYDATWSQIKNISDEYFNGYTVPWPLSFQITRVEDVNAANVEAFVMHPLRAGMEGKSGRQRIRAELLHWHPDKFQSLVLKKVVAYEREGVKKLADTVAQILNELMEKQ